jgi:hypothetical protein
MKTSSQKHLENLFELNRKRDTIKGKKERAREKKILKKMMAANEKVYQMRRQESLDFSYMAITEILPHYIAKLIENGVKVRTNEKNFLVNINHFINLLSTQVGEKPLPKIESRLDFLKLKYLYPTLKKKAESFNTTNQASIYQNYTLEMMHFTKLLNEACIMYSFKVKKLY